MPDQNPNLTVVHLVRHGEVHNPEKILYGRTPGFRLSDRGEQMAAAAGDYLVDRAADQPVSWVVASPLERAVQTAQVIADRLAIVGQIELAVAIDELLLESQNVFAGRKLRRRDLLWNVRKLYNPFRPSWDEPYRSIAARMTAAIYGARDMVAQKAPRGGAAVLVSHQLPIWVARRNFSGQRLWHSPRRRQCALGSVTSLTFRGQELTGIDYQVPAPELVAAALADDRAARVVR